MRSIRLAIAALLTFFASVASAQGLADRPITLISPFPPGGGTDTITRLAANGLASVAGWTTVVENKPGAGGNLALDTTARSRPDGHTLVMAQTDNVVLNPWLYDKLSYDTFRDFTPIGLVASSPSVFVVLPDSPFKTVGDVVAAAKRAPGKIALGVPGAGSSGDLLGRLWQKYGQMELNIIPYRGWAQAFPDLASKRIEVYTGSLATLIGQIQGGTVRAIGLVAPGRAPIVPDVPTFVESGFPQIDQTIWWGLLAAAKTPPDVVAQLNAALAKVLANPENVSKLESLGYSVLGGSPAEMAARYKADYDTFGRIIREAGIKAVD